MITRRGPAARLLLALLLLQALPAAMPVAGQVPLTGAERSGFRQHTTHDEMMAFLQELRAASPDMRLVSFGASREGRDLPLAILSRPLVATPAEAALLGRPVVLLAANVHGGERTLRESLLALLRQLATPGTPENRLLDHVVVLVAPQLNPDGFHASEQGTRGNAWGVDLNRDYIKLGQPETQGIVALLHAWRPHLLVDGHNGGALPYNVLYQCPSHASVDARLTALCDDEIFPFIDRSLEAEGYRSWYYAGGTATRWQTGGFQARIGRNYSGLANIIGILLESPVRQGMQTGVTTGYIAYRAVLEYVSREGTRLVTAVQRARYETLTRQLGGDVVVEMRYGPEQRRVQYIIPVEENGLVRWIEVTSDSLMKRPVPVRTRPRPYAYVLPREATAAVALLQRHGIILEQLSEAAVLDVQAYTVARIDHAQQHDHAAAVAVTVGEMLTLRRTFPAGTWVVPLGQLNGRIAAHMLEPETDDNVIYWNAMDSLLPRPGSAPAPFDDDTGDPLGRPDVPEPPLVPIFKLMTEQSLPGVLRTAPAQR
jgi:hypothetical protein